MAILVCGGAGYIGSHINKQLHKEGYDTIVFDNLIYGHKEAVKWGKLVVGDLKNVDEIEAVFKNNQIDAVFHFAAYAYVGESVEHPEKYYYNNVANTLNLLHVMMKYGCNRIIFSSTCATYGEPEKVPITEDMPQNPINPYGATKLMVERIFQDYHKAYGIQYVVLRYFNAAGADPDGEIGESHNPETHIIPLVLDAASGKRPHELLILKSLIYNGYFSVESIEQLLKTEYDIQNDVKSIESAIDVLNLDFSKKDKKDFQKQYRIPIHTLPFMEDPLHLKEAERLFLKTLV